MVYESKTQKVIERSTDERDKIYRFFYKEPKNAKKTHKKLLNLG